MKIDMQQRAMEYQKKRRKRGQWRKLVFFLAVIVALSTIYAMNLPAITLEEKCKIPEHTHNEACYSQIGKTPICTVEGLDIHKHTGACKNSDGVYICGYADFVAHEHDESCYSKDGRLQCLFPEIKLHTHGKECYAEEPPVHRHADDCYAGKSKLVCRIQESAGHQHEASCLDEAGKAICGIEAGEGAHAHGQDCYEKVRGELICTESTEPAAPRLICSKPEIILHEHGSSCFDAQGGLTCEKVQVLEHKHSDGCFENESAVTESLICSKKEHTHSDACQIYGSVSGSTQKPTEELTEEATEELTEEPTEEATEELTEEPTEESTEKTTEEHAGESTEEQGIPSLTILADWLVQGNVSASAGPMRMPMRAAAATINEARASTLTLDKKYIVGAVLSYRTGFDAEWQTVTSETVVPGTADLRLNINYKDVNIQDLINAGYQITYTLPDIMRNPSVNDRLLVEGVEAGTITADDETKTVTLNFYPDWVAQQKNTRDVINGGFFVESDIDLSHVPGDHPLKLIIGSVKIDVNFEEDVVAKYAQINMEKRAPVFSHEASGDYLTYTLIVTAGQDGAPDVKVKDEFTGNGDWIEYYVGVTGTATSTNDNTSADAGPVEKKNDNPVDDASDGTVKKEENGPMIWEIGNMAANEKRTLTYKVKLKDEYTRDGHKDTITNTATPSSKEYNRDPVASSFPLNMVDYIEEVKLSYRTSSDAEWQTVTSETVVPGTADLRLDIKYKDVNIQDLINTGYKITYTLPDIMRNPSVNGKLLGGGTDAGTITAEGKTVTLTFDPVWVAQQAKSNSFIHGDFYVESDIDLSQVPEPGNTHLIIGDVEIDVNFEPDVVAKYAQINMEKSAPVFKHEASGDYLTYTLTVTAGQDGAPNVRVEDKFTINSDWIESYVGVTGKETPTSDNTSPNDGPVEKKNDNPVDDVSDGTVKKEENGPMVWNIGNMAANEKRTLTYKVKLKDEYTRDGHTDTITNEAKPFSKEHGRDPVTSNFTAKAQTNVTKQSAKFVPDGNGGGSITYTVWVQADPGNTYTLDNVKIEDSLNSDGYSTDAKYLSYLSYEPSSFHLYRGGSENQNGNHGIENSEIGDAVKLGNPDFAESGHSFTFDVGSLGKGECKTLTYTVKVDPGAFVTAGNSDIMVKNRVSTYVGNSETSMSHSDRSHTISRKVWSRKLAGEKLEAAKSISMAGETYDVTGGSVVKMQNPGSFTAPVGSYEYQIVANEAGDWDISSASMTDVLSGGYMQFVGYVRVDAYRITGNAPSSDLTDQAAISALGGREPAKTVWVHPNETSFAFKPQDIGLGGEKYAYLLTYYAQPVNLDNVTQVIVSNTFTLEGVIGGIRLTGIEADASVTVEGANSFKAEKMSWYYAKATENPGNFDNGAMYWIIKVDGNVLPKGTIFRDNTEGATEHYVHDDSVAGVYTGNLAKPAAEDYDNLDELLKSGKLTAVDRANYSVTRENDKNLTIKLEQKVELQQGHSLYIIVKTEPSWVPTGIRETKTFKNTLKSSYDGEHWVTHRETEQVLCGSSGVFKELNRVITWDGNKVIHAEIKDWTHTHDDLLYDLMPPGTYAIWHVQANYLGDLNGRYRFEETIPEGMELVYVSHYWYGPEYGSNPPRSVEVEPADLDALGGAWDRHETSKNNVNCIYYTQGQKAIWEVDGLVPGGVLDGYGVEYQIACRVTDPDVLLGKQEKEFNNQINLYDEEGKEAGTCSNSVNVDMTTLTKAAGSLTPETNGGRYPFIIEVNPLGEDLASASDTITLVDKLGDNLELDSSSIHVTNKKTNAELSASEWTLSVDEDTNTFQLILPDRQPLTITYETTVKAAPNTPVTITNNAHWEGYASSDSSVKDENFKYEVGGTAGGDTSPSLVITKANQNNVSEKLSGAVFELERGSYENGVFTPDNPRKFWTGTTDDNGSLTFGVDVNQTMEYNVVYRLRETVFPDGFVPVKDPIYIAVAKDKTDFPEGVKVCYNGSVLNLTVYNRRGEIKVSKQFKDAGGNPCNPIPGTYRFGLYETAEATGDCLQEATIIYDQSDVSTKEAVFKDLDLNKKYYVFELDEQGRPIKQNELAAVSNSKYLVTYESSVRNELNGATNDQTVTVTNWCVVELPATGGPGTALFTLCGILLIVFAGTLLLAGQRGRFRRKTALG